MQQFLRDNTAYWGGLHRELGLLISDLRDQQRLAADKVRLYVVAEQTPPRHPCYQWELKPTGFSEGYKNLIPEKTIFTPC